MDGWLLKGKFALTQSLCRRGRCPLRPALPPFDGLILSDRGANMPGEPIDPVRDQLAALADLKVSLG